MENIEQHIEALIFVSKKSISFDEIKAALDASFDTEISIEALKAAIQRLENKYALETSSLEVVEIAGGYQFLTKIDYHVTVGAHLKNITKKQLSKAALETLSIVAYKQPVTKSTLEAIRGVGCDYALHKLLEKELIDVKGRSEGPGRPLLYGTSEKFMDYFGIKDLIELPKPKDFKVVENEVGAAPKLDNYQTQSSIERS